MYKKKWIASIGFCHVDLTAVTFDQVKFFKEIVEFSNLWV